MRVANITARLQKDSTKLGVLLFAALYALLVMTVFLRLNSDTAAQLGQVQSHLKGHGFTFATVEANDLAQTEYVPNSDFAAGYPLLITPLMQWLGFVPSILLVNLLAVVVLLGVCYAIDQLLSPYTGPFFLPLLLLMFVTSPLLFHYCAATDLLSLAFFMLSLVLATRIISGAGASGRRLVYLAVGVGVTAYLCCFFRYAYYVLMFIPVFVLGAYGLIYKKRLWKSFFTALGALLLLLSAQLLLQSGSGYIKSRHGSTALKTVHWEHLQRTDNFVLNSLVYEEFLEHLLTNKLNLSPGFAQGVVVLLTAAILGILILGLLPVVRHDVGRAPLQQAVARPIVMLGVVGGGVALANVAFLVMLSLWFELYKLSEHNYWTYVEETRYYAPTAVFILVFLLLVMLNRGGVGSRLVRWGTGAVLMVALLANLYQHLGGFVLWLRGRTDGTISTVEMARLINNSRNEHIVFVAPHTGANYAEFALAAGAVACDITTFQKNNGRCSRPISLYLAIPSTLPEDLKRAMREQVARVKARRVARVRTYGVTEIYYRPDYVKR